MCYLSYYPLENQAVIFTSNRDEQAHRATSEIVTEYTENGVLYYPCVPDIVGSWVMLRRDGTVAVLLNGAFERHRRKPPYRLSRGVVLRQVFDYQSFTEFVQVSDFQGVEPFTIIYKSKDPAQGFWELKWDEKQKHLRALDPALPQTWSSATLYTPEMQLERDAWFKTWLHEKNTPTNNYTLPYNAAAATTIAMDISPQAILRFHTQATGGDKI